MKKKNAGYIDVSYELLNYWYNDRRYPLKFIAENLLYCSHVTVLNRLKEHGIPKREKGPLNKPKFFYNNEYYLTESEVDDAICNYIENTLVEVLHSDYMAEESAEFENEWDWVERL